jgi:hypothetical protein
MISALVEERIRCLLLEDRLSQRQIARVTGVSRASVSAIAQGTRRAMGNEGGESEEFFSISKPPRRCSQCGGLVYMPCHLCRVRAFVSRGHDCGVGQMTQPAACCNS